jgi:SAM-dependent methyltransferase
MGPDARLADVNAYLSTGIHAVDGWCIPQLWQTLWPLYREIGDGPVAEIGLFEGKFFIGLCKTFGVGSQNRGAAIDVFDMQQFNLDGAGVGKLDVVKRNLVMHGIAEDAVSFVQADSLALTHRDADRLVREIGQFHFFSVDGCHEVVHTVNDIEFAMSVMANHGIIAVDDYTNPNWPGVQEAVARMYLSRDFRFIPLAVTCNKLLLASCSYHAAYLRAIEAYLRRAHSGTRMKRVKRFGFETLTIQPSIQTWVDLSLSAE